jgi:imidazolonepropionase-like amidohydrolase
MTCESAGAFGWKRARAEWKPAWAMAIAWLAALSCVPVTVAIAEESGLFTALVGGQLIDGRGAAAIPDSTVLFEGDVIVAVGPRASVEIPDGAIVIDVAGRTIVPGIIDSNGHVAFNGQIDHAAYFALRHDDYYRIGAHNLYTALLQGVTTIRDTMGPLDELLRLQREVEDGVIAGSRLFIAGSILNYESLLDIPTERSLSEKDIAAARRSMDLFVEDRDQGLAIIREYAARGVNLIKISVEGNPPGGEPPVALSVDVLAQLVSEAHKLGLRTSAHALSIPGLKRALHAGFDALEHPEILFSAEPGNGRTVSIPDEVVRQIVELGVYSIPLIVAMEVYPKFLQNPELLEDPAVLQDLPADMVLEARQWASNQRVDPGSVERWHADYAIVRGNLSKLIAAGALIAMGTDKGTRLNYHEHANHVREMAIYVELGMSPSDAIVAATRRGAELLGREDRLGTIAPGRQADIVVIASDPLADINAMGGVVMVFKNGIRYR